jgi:hypothetical protein
VKRIIEIEPAEWRRVKEHLLLRDPVREQAAFLFATERATEDKHVLSVIGLRLIDADELAFHSSYHLELKEKTWSTVIKEAHQRKAALIEVHSHLGDEPAEFSASDLYGLTSTVPHVAWRLKGRPFAALVVTRNDFDALVWPSGESAPDALSALRAGRQEFSPTLRSRSRWHDVQHDSLRPQHRALRQ